MAEKTPQTLKTHVRLDPPFHFFLLPVAAGNIVIVLALFGRLFPRLTAVQAQMHYLTGNLHAVEVIDRLQGAAEAEAERQEDSGTALAVTI